MKFKQKINNIGYALRFMKGCSAHWIAIFWVYAASNALFSVFPVVIVARIIDELAAACRTDKLMQLVCLLLVGEFCLFMLRSISERLYANSSAFIREHEYKSMEERIVYADYELLENSEFQENVKAYRSAAENQGGMIVLLYMQGFRVVNGFISLGLALWSVFPVLRTLFVFDNSRFVTSWKFSLLLLVFVIMAAILMSVSGIRQSAAVCQSQKILNGWFGNFKYWSKFGEQYGEGKEIRIYKAQPLIQNHLTAFTKKVCESLKNAYWCTRRYETFNLAMQAILTAALFFFVAVKAWAGMLSVGDLTLFVGMTEIIVSAIGMVSTLGFILGNTAENIQYFRRIIEWKPVKHKGTLPVEKRNDNQYNIEFKNVSFKYPGTDTYVLKNFSVKLTVGEHLAIVGINGSGKTTFIKLLCRLYDVTDGEILLNGINIKKYDLQEYMSIFSVVFQDFQLFSVPLDQNVTTSLEQDSEKLWDCLDKAGIAEWVRQLKNREKTVLYKDFDDDGIEISGGEAQKIALARALYKDGPFIILDEPTAALDPIAEYDIYRRFNAFVGEKTAIYISHRLSSCRFCDKIAVFDEGRIVQLGSHEQLLADKQGKYYALWNAQAQYYTVKNG